MAFTLLDTTDNLLGLAPAIKKAEYAGAFKYSAATKLYPHKNWSLKEIEEFHDNNLVCAVVFEGANTQDVFTPTNGVLHGKALAAEMTRLGFPKNVGKGGFLAYDLQVEITPALLGYASEARKPLEDAGYLPGAYGQGTLFDALEKEGTCHWFWLSQSTGFPGYKSWLRKAHVVQNMNIPMNLSADGDVATTLAFAY
jgi:Domain of unknown function (DUF1906)